MRFWQLAIGMTTKRSQEATHASYYRNELKKPIHIGSLLLQETKRLNKLKVMADKLYRGENAQNR